MKVFKIFVAVAIALYLLLLAIFFFAQRSFLYFPSHLYVPLSEARASRAFQEFAVRTSDGIDLRGWYAPATTKPFTIVFFHGNADSLRTAAPIANPYIAAGYGFLATTYRGYSGLRGRPTETGLYNDGRAYIQGLVGRGVASENIILFGHSLGTGVAVQMAVEFQVRGVMLLAPFLSVPKLASIHFPFFPSSFLVLDRFDNERKISNIHSPLLIANGDQDQVVPLPHGPRLYALANQPKEFHSFPGRGHNDAFDQFALVSIDWIARACSRTDVSRAEVYKHGAKFKLQGQPIVSSRTSAGAFRRTGHPRRTAQAPLFAYEITASTHQPLPKFARALSLATIRWGCEYRARDS